MKKITAFCGLLFSLFTLQIAIAAPKHSCAQHYRAKCATTVAQALQGNDVLDIAANNSRSDTLDVLHYDISLQLTNLSASATLVGSECALRIVPKINALSQILLDLEDLDVSAVEVNGLPTDYTHSGITLRINLATPANTTDTLNIQVHYNGNPPTASFGGFYFATGYAYNLGVGIGVNPPAYGRAWFPCIDNFIDRATYSFHITTQATRKAFCNGLLENVSDNADGTKTWHWNMYQSIPTYLASVAVSQYETLAWDYYGIADTIPVQIGVRAADTTDCRNSFIHLNNCIAAYEQAYGAYRFDRIGYVMVPFNGGAMEHATNIAYPNFAIDGTLAWESLMSHEFSHHWFGDLVTCQTPADMWLNEGWASYSAQYFLEAVYGKQRYLDEVRSNHDDVMRTAHITDGEHLAVANVPFDATYGKHVYDKGADVAHTLRGYMGDSLFFHCLQNYLNEYAFSTANTDQFRDYLSACSDIDLNYFFNDWVKQPGWAHFSIVPYIIMADAPKSEYYVNYLIRQRGYANPNMYQQVPLEVTLFDAHFNQHKVTVTSFANCAYDGFSNPFEPVYMALDFEEKINDATTDYHHFIDSVGVYNFPSTYATVNTDTIADTTLLRVVHNYIAPDRKNSLGTNITPANIILSPNHFWTIEGYSQSDFHATASFNYNGSTSGVGAYLDNSLITGSENNLRLLYRPLLEPEMIVGGMGSSWDGAWTVVSDAILNSGASTTDKRGTITTPTLRYGEYALGYYNATANDTTQTNLPCINYILSDIGTIAVPNVGFSIQPNPSKGVCQIVLPQVAKAETKIVVYDATGKQIYQDMFGGNSNLTIATDTWKNGVYMVCLYEKKQLKNCAKLLVNSTK
jgi:hypothetical protein